MNTLLDRMLPRGRFVLAALAITVAGCTVGPDYQRPADQAAARFMAQDALQQRDAGRPAPALESWWKGFDDPQLTQLIQKVLAQNLDLAVAMARVDQARAVAQEAGATRMPQGSLDGQVVRQRQSLESPEGQLASHQPGYERNQTLSNIGAGASWELDLAGGLKRGEQAALDDAQAAQASQAGVRVSVAAEAADAYLRIRGAQQRIQVTEQQIKNQGDLLALVEARLAQGLGNQRETAQARAVLQQARTTLPPLRTELAVQLNRLDVLMGVAPGTYARDLAGTAPEKIDYKVPQIPANIAPGEMLRRRPDVIAAERRLAASNERIGVAVAEFYPKVSLGGLLGFSSLHSGSLFTAQAFQPQALLGLHWRLFDFGRVDAEVAQAKGANAQALAEYRQSMLRASEDVENAVVTLTQLEAQRQELALEITSRQTARQAASEAYQGGAVSLIEVLNEDSELLRTRNQMAELNANDARAAVATFRALGGGWSVE
ncbi:efflux transporter outer membrane subunit [Pseudomonas batumici]|uniref:Outer membrane component of tripartite multidrug resistance system n=1 Tax=Pseudomonas batumici TaxID=226910 RepID=A0A0C2ED46_9PSED|nr:efflux transporter outer membrane subunit [Pseudomonas batumici]KIH83854.1 Outer membrane component of tripartite multidrug resistance system [Pseudomonas batumici]